MTEGEKLTDAAEQDVQGAEEPEESPVFEIRGTLLGIFYTDGTSTEVTLADTYREVMDKIEEALEEDRTWLPILGFSMADGNRYWMNLNYVLSFEATNIRLVDGEQTYAAPAPAPARKPTPRQSPRKT